MSTYTTSYGTNRYTCYAQSSNVIKATTPTIVSTTVRPWGDTTSVSASLYGIEEKNNKTYYGVLFNLVYTIPTGCKVSTSGTPMVLGAYCVTQNMSAMNSISISKTIYYAKDSTNVLLAQFPSWKYTMSNMTLSASVTCDITSQSSQTVPSLNGNTPIQFHLSWTAKNQSGLQTAGSTDYIKTSLVVQGKIARFDFNYTPPESFSTTGSWGGWSFSSVNISGTSDSFTIGNYTIGYDILSPNNNF